jgi:hypothetical protein
VCVYLTSFIPLRPKRVQIIFKNLVFTAKKTLHFTITKINWLILLKEITGIKIDKYKKTVNKKPELLIVKAGGMYGYHLILEEG